jgi:pentatricopeptide repeat protein
MLRLGCRRWLTTASTGAAPSLPKKPLQLLKNSHPLNKVLASSTRRRDLGNIAAVLARMEKAGVPPDLHNLQALLELHAEAGRVDAVETLVRLVRQSGASLTGVMYRAMVAMWLRLGNVDTAAKVVEEMRAEGVPVDAHVYGSLAKGWASTKRPDRARAALEAMEATASTAGPSSRADQYAVLIEHAAMAGDYANVDALVAEARGRGVEITGYLYSVLIRTWDMARRLDKVDAAYREMVAAGKVPDDYTYNILINSYARAGRHEVAERLLRTAQGHKKDIVTANTLIKMWSAAGKTDKAEAVFKRLATEWGCAPNVVTYNTMMEMWAKAGRMDMAAALLADMRLGGVRPSIITFNIFAGLQAAVSSDPVGSHKKLVLEMAAAGLSPTVITFTPVAKRLVNDGTADDFTELIAMLRASNLKPDAFISDHFLAFAFKQKNRDLAVETVAAMTAKTETTRKICQCFTPPIDCTHLPFQASVKEAGKVFGRKTKMMKV